MIIFFLADSEKNVSPFMDRMRGYGHVVVHYSDVDDLCVAINENRVGGICLVAADFRIFGTQSRCPYETMCNLLKGLKAPFVFYNDPFPEISGLYDYWMETLKEYSPLSYSETGIVQPLHNLAECMAEAKNRGVEKSEEEKSEDEKISPGELLEKLSVKFKIPPSKMDLLRLFVENRGICLDGDEICKMLWGNSEPLVRGRLHAYISWLRKNVLNDMSKPYAQILSDGNGAYIFRTSCSPKKSLVPNSNELHLGMV